MKNVKFYQLDCENKLAAITQMLGYKHKYNWPDGVSWNCEDDIATDLQKDYNPDDHFTFYTDEFNEVTVKII